VALGDEEGGEKGGNGEIGEEGTALEAMFAFGKEEEAGCDAVAIDWNATGEGDADFAGDGE